MKHIYSLYLLIFLSLPFNAAAQPDGDECHASEVICYSPGFVLGNVPFDPRRTNPDQALGAPENDDGYNFVSLGFGGEMVLAFAQRIKNGDGDDIKVYETSFGRSGSPCAVWPEKVEVWVSQDNRKWFSAGIGCRTSTFAIPDHLMWVQYVKLIDVSNPADFQIGDEGYDVDGIECLHGPYEYLPVKPLATCVQKNQDGSYIGRLGYYNQNDFEVEIAAGANNFLSPELDVSLPETFQPGLQEDALTFLFDGAAYVWTLKGPDSTTNTITISAGSNACASPIAYAGISGDVVVCEGEKAEIAVELSGQAPWSIAYRDDDGGEYTVSGIQESPWIIEADKAAVYTLTDVSDANGDGIVSGSATVAFRAQPTAVLSGDHEVCEGGEAPLAVELTGEAPWSIAYQLGEETFTATGINSTPYTFNVSDAGTYSLVSVNDKFCSGKAEGSATVEIKTAPAAEISSANPVICGDNGAATLNISLSGTAPFQITYTDGLEQFSVSDIAENSLDIEVAEPGVYELVSVEDAHCPGAVSGSVEVERRDVPEASVVLGDGNFCLGEEPIEIQALPAGGALQGPGVAGGFFDPSAAGAGNHTIVYRYEDADGCVIQGSATATVNEVPTATLSGGGAICDGEAASLTIEFTGNAPWTATYQRDGESFSIADIQSTPHTFSASESGTYSLVSVNDKFCSGDAEGSATIEVKTAPAAQISSANPVICGDNGAATLNVSLSGTAPFQITYTDGQEQFSVSDIAENSLDIEVAEPGVYELVSVEDAHCPGAVSGSVAVERQDLPEVSIDLAADRFCLNEEPASIDVSPAGGILQGQGVANGFFDPSAAGAGDHTITYLYEDAKGCVGQAATTVSVNEVPTAYMYGGAVICNAGEEQPVSIRLSGVQPWTVVYSDGEQEITLTDVTESDLEIMTGKPGEYALASVSDAVCKGTVSGMAEIIDRSQPIEPEFNAPESVCYNEPITISVGGSGTVTSIEWAANGEGEIDNRSSSVINYTPGFNEVGDVAFYVTLKNECSTVQASVTVEIKEPVNAEFTTSGNLVTHTEVQFTPDNEDADGYAWNFGDGETSEEQNAVHVYSAPNHYEVFLTVTEGACESASYQSIEILEGKVLYVPNVFSPSASHPDNRVVKVYGRGISPDNFFFKIVSRWGNVMYETTSLDEAQNIGWNGRLKGDGRMQALGVYSFGVKGQFVDGEPFNVTGTITLVK